MRVFVCGGRDFKDRNKLWTCLDRNKPDLVVHGACPTGADHLAEMWAKDRQVAYLGVPAKWGDYGRKAGPIRNSLMATIQFQIAIICPGNDGTRDMDKKIPEGVEKIYL